MIKPVAKTIHNSIVLAIAGQNPVDYPKQGTGQRFMACSNYEKCLYSAAVKDWESFNCVGCTYAEKGHVKFDPLEYTPKEEELETLFGKYWHLMAPEKLTA